MLYSNNDFAKVLNEKGMSVIIGWDNYNCYGFQKGKTLLAEMLQNNRTLDEAYHSLGNEIIDHFEIIYFEISGKQIFYWEGCSPLGETATMRYYPDPEGGDYTISNLLPTGDIMPLAVGNYWHYLITGNPMMLEVTIPETITYNGELCYKYQTSVDEYAFYYANKNDGCWCYGYSGPDQIPPDLIYKYPAHEGDIWYTRWLYLPDPVTMTCLSFNTTYEHYSHCYEYHFLPWKTQSFLTSQIKNEEVTRHSKDNLNSDDGYDIYLYFVPGTGLVGWEDYNQGNLIFHTILTDYQLNSP
jgi:hypothetical protein